MMNTNNKRLFERQEYNIDQAQEYEKTENSDDKRKPDKKRFTKSSTEADNENKTDNREETEQKETPSLSQGMAIDPEEIPDPNGSQNNGDALDNENQIRNLSGNKVQKKKANSPDSQTHETTKTKDKSKKNFEVKHDNSIAPETKHSKSTKDNKIIKVCRWATNSIFKVLKHRCKLNKLALKKVKVVKLFGKIRKQKWFVKRKLKYIFASKHANKRVIKKMIKEDSIFKKLVELKFEDFYLNYFLVDNRYLPLDRKTFMFLAHFETFAKYLEKEEKKETNENKKEENKKYVDELSKTGFSLIYEINGGGYYESRRNRKRIKTKTCFIRYK